MAILIFPQSPQVLKEIHRKQVNSFLTKETPFFNIFKKTANILFVGIYSMPTAKSHQPSVTFAVDLSLEILYDLLAIRFDSIITTQQT
jgi:hypothetical protein